MKHPPKRAPTSLNIDEDLWLRLKMLALKEKTTATDLFEEAIRNLLRAKEKK